MTVSSSSPAPALETLKERRFFQLVILSLLVAYSPFKVVAFAYPPIFIFLLILYARVHGAHNFSQLVVAIFLYSFGGFVYWLINKDFLWLNFYFFFLTASPFLLLFMNMRDVSTPAMVHKIGRFLIWLCVFQAVVGIIQVTILFVFYTGHFDLAVGDAVQGTIGFSPGSEGRGGNQMFAIMQSSFLFISIILAMASHRRLEYWKLGLILLSWILASMMHSVLMWSLSLLITVCLFVMIRPVSSVMTRFLALRARLVQYTFLTLCLITLLLVVFLPTNTLEVVPNVLRSTFTTDKSAAVGKMKATLVTISDLGEEKPYQRFVGLGPGQYTSRAGLILSGEYLSGGIPFHPSVSPDLERYILGEWHTFLASRQGTSLLFPFYSWLTLYGELGIAGMLCAMGFIVYLIVALHRSRAWMTPYLPMGVMFIALYLMTLGFHDNYWEFSQPIFPILLISKIFYDHIQSMKPPALEPDRPARNP